MAIYAGPEIVNDGLVLHVDAANSRSYPGSGSTLTDLSGAGRHGTLNSVDASAGYCAFNATTDNVAFSSFTIALEKTLSIWIKTDRPLSIQDNFEIGFLNDGGAVSTMFGWMYGVGNCQDLGFWGYGSAYDFSNTSYTNKWSSDGNWHNAVLTMDSSRNVRGYHNGNPITWYRHSDGATATSFALTANTASTFKFHTRDNFSWAGATYFHVGDVKVYNRDLSENEIVQNYNALRGRYGR
jgi:hypothetical protein